MRPWLLLFVLVMAISPACGGGEEGPTPLPSASPSPAVSPKLTGTPAATPVPSPTASLPPTLEPTLPPTPAPTPPSPPAQVIRKGNTNRKTVALTFDAGSDAGYAAQVLDTLKANGVHASFGMTGVWAERNPELVKRIAGEGHHLINHSYDHQSFTGASSGKPALTQAQRWEEMDKTETIVNQLTGATTKPYFRPPYGDYDDSVNADVGARGYQYNVMWSVDSGGWRGISTAEITQRCLDGAEPGAIVVMHVGAASQDGPALQGVIDGLRAAGYAIGAVPDVLAP